MRQTVDCTDLILNSKFVDGGRGENYEYDCWGLTMEVFRRYGIELPEYSISCANASQRIKAEEIEKIDKEINSHRGEWTRCTNGDNVPALVVIRFTTAQLYNHVGVYIGCGRFIHIRKDIGCSIEQVDNILWRKRVDGLYIPRWVDYDNINNS